jgi:hypothetical protein
MKLRIKGDSLRLRVARSELARIQSGERVRETIHFTTAPEAKLSYALEMESQSAPVRVEYEAQEVRVILSKEQAITWSKDSEVGVYATVDIGTQGKLEVMIEKDFACLDRDEQNNEDTFANPHSGRVC